MYQRCGSGDVSAFLSSMLPEGLCLSSDVNVNATEKTKLTFAEQNIRNSDILLCDLFAAFKTEVQFDLIVFNPPYVPTDHGELDRALQTRDISAAWAGGKDGRYIIDLFLRDSVSFLSVHGVIYLVVLKENNPTQIQVNARRLGLQVTTVSERKAGVEHLYILRFQRS